MPLPEDEARKIIEDAYKFQEENNTDKKDKNKGIKIIGRATEFLMQRNRFLTIEENKDILYYTDGVYKKGGDIIIEKAVEKLLGYELSNRYLSEIKGHVMRRTYHKLEEIDADINIINLKNGLYNIKDDILLPHTPDHLSINQKPITYVKGTKPKLWASKFLKEVLFPWDIRMGVDITAYTFRRDYAIERIFVKHGLGNNGKSLYDKVIHALHGHNNISNVPLSDMLGGDQYALSDLEHKDANIDDELEVKPMKDIGNLKRVAGNNPVRIQRKNQRAYDIIPYAKIICNANKIPPIDPSDAGYKRLGILVFPIQFEGKTDDRKLDKKLTTEEELSGIFNVCMIALRRILKNGDIYSVENTVELRRIKYERMFNPVKGFVEEALEVDPDGQIEKEVMYEAHQKYCNKYHIPLKKHDPFCKGLKTECDFQDPLRNVKSGVRKRVWIGYVLTKDYVPETEQQTRL